MPTLKEDLVDLNSGTSFILSWYIVLIIVFLLIDLIFGFLSNPPDDWKLTPGTMGCIGMLVLVVTYESKVSIEAYSKNLILKTILMSITTAAFGFFLISNIWMLQNIKLPDKWYEPCEKEELSVYEKEELEKIQKLKNKKKSVEKAKDKAKEKAKTKANAKEKTKAKEKLPNTGKNVEKDKPPTVESKVEKNKLSTDILTAEDLSPSLEEQESPDDLDSLSDDLQDDVVDNSSDNSSDDSASTLQDDADSDKKELSK